MADPTAAGAAAAGADGGPAFCEARHVAFIRGLMGKSDSFEHVVMEHLKVRPSVRPAGRPLLFHWWSSKDAQTNPDPSFGLHWQMSAVYWALMGMALMGRDLEAEMDLGKIVEWVLECQHPNGGYALIGLVACEAFDDVTSQQSRPPSLAGSGATWVTTPTCSTRSRRCRSWPSRGSWGDWTRRRWRPTSPRSSRSVSRDRDR